MHVRAFADIDVPPDSRDLTQRAWPEREAVVKFDPHATQLVLPKRRGLPAADALPDADHAGASLEPSRAAPNSTDSNAVPAVGASQRVRQLARHVLVVGLPLALCVALYGLVPMTHAPLEITAGFGDALGQHAVYVFVVAPVSQVFLLFLQVEFNWLGVTGAEKEQSLSAILRRSAPQLGVVVVLTTGSILIWLGSSLGLFPLSGFLSTVISIGGLYGFLVYAMKTERNTHPVRLKTTIRITSLANLNGFVSMAFSYVFFSASSQWQMVASIAFTITQFLVKLLMTELALSMPLTHQVWSPVFSILISELFVALCVGTVHSTDTFVVLALMQLATNAASLFVLTDWYWNLPVRYTYLRLVFGRSRFDSQVAPAPAESDVRPGPPPAQETPEETAQERERDAALHASYRKRASLRYLYYLQNQAYAACVFLCAAPVLRYGVNRAEFPYVGRFMSDTQYTTGLLFSGVQVGSVLVQIWLSHMYIWHRYGIDNWRLSCEDIANSPFYVFLVHLSATVLPFMLLVRNGNVSYFFFGGYD